MSGATLVRTMPPEVPPPTSQDEVLGGPPNAAARSLGELTAAAAAVIGRVIEFMTMLLAAVVLLAVPGLQFGGGLVGPLVGAMIGVGLRSFAAALTLASVFGLTELAYGVLSRSEDEMRSALLSLLAVSSLVAAATALVPVGQPGLRGRSIDAGAAITGAFGCLIACGTAGMLATSPDVTPRTDTADAWLFGAIAVGLSVTVLPRAYRRMSWLKPAVAFASELGCAWATPVMATAGIAVALDGPAGQTITSASVYAGIGAAAIYGAWRWYRRPASHFSASDACMVALLGQMPILALTAPDVPLPKRVFGVALTTSVCWWFARWSWQHYREEREAQLRSPCAIPVSQPQHRDS